MNLRLSLVIGLLMLSFSSHAQAPLITNAPNRASLSLDGAWHYIIDPYQNGYFSYRLTPHDEHPNPGSGAYFTNVKPKDKSDRVEYDFDQSPTLSVPGSWNAQADNLLYYEGTLWYQRNFSYQKPAGKRLFLYFGASNYQTHVYVNGEKAGSHTGGFTPFNFEVTDLVQDGDNFVTVMVDNTRARDAVPTVNTDWWNHGGITRSVELIALPQTFIQSFMLQLKKGSQEELAGYVQVQGAEGGEMVRLRIPALEIEQNVAVDANGLASLSLKAKNLELWDTDNPKRYQVELSCGEDQTSDQIGFRSIETKGTDILLNGKKVLLRGICMHEENPIDGSRISTEAEVRMMLQWVKELNANFIRLAHYPHNEHMARIADEMGILLWEEIPVYWTIQWENEATLHNAQQQLTELITRDRNRASVIIWSMSNETPVSEARNTFLKKLVDSTRVLDDTRLISAALEVHGNQGQKILDDPFGVNTDIVSFNQYHGWYGGSADSFKELTWIVKYDKPVLVSEWGGGALYGYHADKETIWSEEFQAYLYEKTLEGMDNIPGLSGFTPWILTDFRSPRRNLPVIQEGWNRKGIIGEGGHKKQAFYVLQKYYEEKMRP